MGLMNARNVNDWVVKNIHNLKEGYVIRVENHKNDRWLEIRRLGDKYSLKEVGYTNRDVMMNEKELFSSLNSIIYYEFPRSHMLRVKMRAERRETLKKIIGR
jgi:hypothetical protein